MLEYASRARTFRRGFGAVGRWAVAALISVGVQALAPSQAAAQSYPSKPIRIVHGYAAGSSMDTNARYVAQKLSEILGQSVIVDIRAGATGTIAAESVARSEPDGYTLLAAPGSGLASTPYLQQVRWDPLRDFTPVSLIGEFSQMLVTNKSAPFATIPELVKYAKANPAKLAYGSNGVGSAYHLSGVLLSNMAGIDILHVPYKGGGSTLLADLIGDRVQLMWNSPVFSIPHVKSGELRALGTTGTRRLAATPDVPTIGESVPGYEMVGWQGIVAPAGLPKDVLATLNGAMAKILDMPETRKVWSNQGMDVVIESPDQFAKRLRADYENYGKLIKQLGKVD